MHLSRRSKSKLPKTSFSNLKTVEVGRGRTGYGFTMTGQYPCVLSCIIPGSPSDVAGLKAGDCVMAINGENVTRIGHEQIIKLIGSTSGVLRLTVAEIEESESSDEDYIPAPRVRFMRSKNSTPTGINRDEMAGDDQATYYEKQPMYGKVDSQSKTGIDAASKFAPGHLSPYNRSGRSAVMLQKPASNYNYTIWNGKGFEKIGGSQKPRKVKRHAENKQFRHRAYSAQSHSSYYAEGEEDDDDHADLGLRPLTPVEVSNIMYPSHRSNTRSGSRHRRSSALIEERQVLMHAIVGYLGSIDIPASANLPTASLQAIRGCVRRLHLEQRIHSLMLMEITNIGVALINANRKVTVLYPAERITFSGVCPDDKRCFGIVTVQNPEQIMESVDSDEEPIGSSCHVFIIDPSLCLHNIHYQMAARFNVQCNHDPATNTCQQFPASSRPLLTFIAQLHRDHGDSLHFADFYGQSPYPAGPRRSNSNSSNSDSGFGNGKENEANGHGDRVMIVDVAGHIRSQRTRGLPDSQSTNDASPNRRVVHAEINTSQSSYSISSPSSPEQSPQSTNLNDPSGRLTPRARPDPVLKDVNGHHTPRARPSVILNTSSGRLTPRARPDPIGFRSPLAIPVSSQEQEKVVLKQRPQSVNIMVQPQYQPPNTNGAPPQNLQSIKSDVTVQLRNRQIASTNAKGRPPTGRHSMYAKMDTSHRSREPLNMKTAEIEVKKRMSEVQNPSVPRQHDLHLARRNSDCSEYSSSNLKTSMQRALRARKIQLIQPGTRESLAASDGELDSPEADSSLKSDGNRSNPNLLQISDGQEIGRVSSWAVSFDRLLQDELGLDCFTKFLKREFSEENIMFWIACETMSKLTSKEELKRMADHIYSKHLSDDASMPVNLDSSCRLKVELALKSPTPEMFKLQQQQIFKLMKYDSYSRFLKSKVYQDCLLAEMAGNPLPISISRQRSDGSVSSVDDTPGENKKGALQGQKGNKKKYQIWKTSKTYSLDINEESPDKKRKSLLPWINRAKLAKKISKDVEPNKDTEDSQVQISSSGGNTLNKVISVTANSPMNGKTQAIPAEGTCHLVFPNNDVVVLPARAGFTVRDVLSPHLEVRQLNFQSVETFLADSKEIIDFKQDMSIMAGAQIVVEQRVVFKIELPSHRVIGVKSKPSKKLIEVLRPVTYKYNLQLDALVVHLSNSPVPFDLDITVASLDGQRILIETLEQYGAGHYKAQARVDPGTTDYASHVMHKSASAESFINKDSSRPMQTVQRRFSENGTHVKETTSASDVQAVTLRPSNSDSSVSMRQSQNRCYRITNNDAEELYTMLSKAQRRRMDDQRGLTIRNLELPDFLKKPDKEIPDQRSKSSLGAPYQFNTPEFLHSYETKHHAEKKLRFRDMAVRSKSTPPTSNIEIGFREGIIPSHSQAEAVFGGRGHYSDIPQIFNESMTAMAGDAYGYDEHDVDMMGYGYRFNGKSMFNIGDDQTYKHDNKLSPRAYPSDRFNTQADEHGARARGYSLEIHDASLNDEHHDDQDNQHDLDQTLTKSICGNETLLPPLPDDLDRTLHFEEANYSPPPSLAQDTLNHGNLYTVSNCNIQGSTLPGHSTDFSHQPLTDTDSIEFGINPLSDDLPPSPSTHDLIMTPNLEEKFDDLSQRPFHMAYNFKQEFMEHHASVGGRPDVLESLHNQEKDNTNRQSSSQHNTSQQGDFQCNTSLYVTSQHTSPPTSAYFSTPQNSASHRGSSQSHIIKQGTSLPNKSAQETSQQITSLQSTFKESSSQQDSSQSSSSQGSSVFPNQGINLQQTIDCDKWETVVKDGRTMRATFV